MEEAEKILAPLALMIEDERHHSREAPLLAERGADVSALAGSFAALDAVLTLRPGPTPLPASHWRSAIVINGSEAGSRLVACAEVLNLEEVRHSTGILYLKWLVVSSVDANYQSR